MNPAAHRSANASSITFYAFDMPMSNGNDL